MCDRCEELEERVAWLESELGLQVSADLVDRIRRGLGGIGQQSKANGTARLIAALYAANGRPMTRWQLLDAIPSRAGNEERNANIISVWVSFARKKLGPNAIHNAWDVGYRLTPEGMARISAILEPARARAAA